MRPLSLAVKGLLHQVDGQILDRGPVQIRRDAGRAPVPMVQGSLHVNLEAQASSLNAFIEPCSIRAGVSGAVTRVSPAADMLRRNTSVPRGTPARRAWNTVQGRLRKLGCA